MKKMNERTKIMGVPNIGDTVSFTYQEEGSEKIYITGRVNGVKEGYRAMQLSLDSGDSWFYFDEDSLEVITNG